MKQKEINWFFVILLIGLVLTLMVIGIRYTIPVKPLLTKPLAVVSSSFTPIYCNDYSFTCCVDVKTSVSANLGMTTAYQCPANANYCLLKSASGYDYIYKGSVGCASGYHPTRNLVGNSFMCDNEKSSYVGDQILGSEYFYGFPTYSNSIIFNLENHLNRLDFCGRAGCTQGVPVQGADGCTFNPSAVYDSSGKLIKIDKSGTSYSARQGECILGWLSGDRHICGNLEEQCTSNSDCSGHTYGNKECNARNLQTYGCKQLNPTLPGGVKTENGQLVFYNTETSSGNFGTIVESRCEIISSQTVQCCGDTDCGSNAFCDRTTFTCKETAQCSQDSDCGVSEQCDYNLKQLKKPVCSLGKCSYQVLRSVDCCSDQDCADGYICSNEKTCVQSTIPKVNCPSQCCVGDTRYFDKPCPPDKPYCNNGVCSATQSESKCSSCWAWLKDKMGIQQDCDIGFFQKIWDSLSCPFYFLKLAIVLFASIFALFFGKQFTQKMFKKQPEWLYWILGITFAGIIGFLGYMFLTWYFIIPLLIITFIAGIIINAIPGRK